MKSTGIVRKIDNLGRIVIPKELRKTMNIKEKDPIEIYVGDNNKRVILEKYNPGCFYCGEADDTFEFKGMTICKSCAKELEDELHNINEEKEDN